MWIRIEMEVEVWGGKVQVEISQIPGGAGYWRLSVDRRYWGCFVDYNGRWEMRLHIVRAERVKRGGKYKDIPSSPPWWFTWADMRILEDMIQEKLPAESRPLTGAFGLKKNNQAGIPG
ncbi:hypothetical protein [Chitinophaga sp. YIM B06452]|uniref:hypothetical protein n=1 Tax=Chitinophaga sp. YIM B06452 TaxID=3082158 RepID=UPI0031FEDBD7